MRRPDIGKIVFDFIWQEPRRCDVQSWEEFIRPDGQFIAEVREERVRFYGPPPNPRILSLGYPLEAQYPGLDYNNPWHRMRLSIGPWHKVIFKAFDTLRLTADEIDSIMTHEGTKFARQQYERQHGVVIRDTTGDDVRPFVEPFLVPRKSNAPELSRPRRYPPWERSAGWRPASPYPVMRVDEDPPDSEDDEVEDYIAGTEVSDGSEDGDDEEEEAVEDHEAMYDGEDMVENQDDDEEEVQDEGQVEDDNENVLHVPQQPAHHRQERPAGSGPASNIHTFEEFLEERYPPYFFPNGPPPASFRVIHTVHQILSEDINECVRIDVNFNHFQLNCWREHARERRHRLCNDGKWGFGLWRVPRHVTRAFYRNRRNTYAALETITHPTFYNVDHPNFAEYNPRVIKDYINACFVDYDGEPVMGQEPTLDLDADDDEADGSGEEDIVGEEPTQPPDALMLDLNSDDEEDENNDDENAEFAAILDALPAQPARAAAAVRMMVRRDSIRSSRSDSGVVAGNNRDRIYSPEHTNGASQ